MGPLMSPATVISPAPPSSTSKSHGTQALQSSETRWCLRCARQAREGRQGAHRHAVVFEVGGDAGRVGVGAPPDDGRADGEEADGEHGEGDHAGGHAAARVGGHQVCSSVGRSGMKLVEYVLRTRVCPGQLCWAVTITRQGL